MHFGKFTPWTAWHDVLENHRKYWEITYRTPLTNDVLGSLWPDEVTAALQKISSWKK